MPGTEEIVVEVRSLDFSYRGPGDQNVLVGLDLRVTRGSRCLLVGANGAGKTTLLGVLAGQHMVEESKVRILGRPAFHDTSLVSRVSFLGGPFPFDADIEVGQILARQHGVDRVRQDRLATCLGVDPAWRMHRVSSGQRRRVQILLSLLRPVELLLLDEVTTDLDVVSRANLLAFLHQESTLGGTTILYATHIFDGLDTWATHLAFLERGQIRLMSRLDAIPEFAALSGTASPLLRLVEGWLRRGP